MGHLKKFRVVRTETVEYVTEIMSRDHSSAEDLAKIQDENLWVQQGFYIDYVPVLMEEADDEDE